MYTSVYIYIYIYTYIYTYMYVDLHEKGNALSSPLLITHTHAHTHTHTYTRTHACVASGLIQENEWGDVCSLCRLMFWLRTGLCCSVLQCVAVCCSVLQCAAVFPYHCSSVCDVCSFCRHIIWLRRGLVHTVSLTSVALLYTTVCYSVLQCVFFIS